MKVFYLDEEEDPVVIGEIIANRSFVFIAYEGVTDETSWWKFIEDKDLELEDYTPLSKAKLKSIIELNRGKKSLIKDVGHGHGLWQDDKGNVFVTGKI